MYQIYGYDEDDSRVPIFYPVKSHDVALYFASKLNLSKYSIKRILI